MTTMNGQMRKSLASQIDRLDSMLDGLADGLNEAVVMAVKQAVEVAVQEAVKSVLIEVLTNAELRTQLLGNIPARTNDGPSTSEAVRNGAKSVVGAWIATKLKNVGERCRLVVRKVWTGIRTLVGRCQSFSSFVWQQTKASLLLALNKARIVRVFWRQLLTALGVGTAAGAACYFADPWVATVASGLGGFAVAMGVHVWLALRRLLPGFEVLGAEWL